MDKRDFKLDFIGVGFGRTGSNWLCNCLIEHPELSIPKFNLHTEINYFPKEYEVMGLKNYIKKFKKCNFNKKVGEISTMIIMEKRSAKLLKKLFPKTKIIIYQRSEEGRSKSTYNIMKHHDLLDVDQETLKINQQEYIEPWLQEFGKKNVFIFEMDNPKKQEELNKLFKFLKIKKFIPSGVNKRTNTSYSDPKKKIPIKSKYPLTRNLINLVKNNFIKYSKIYYFFKRNLHFDYLYQLVNHNMSK